MKSKEKHLEAKYLTEIQGYYSDEYRKAINIDSVENKSVRDYLNKSELDFWSHKNRIVRNVQTLKHTFIMPKTDIVTSCFKVSLNATSCIYGYVHSRWCHNPKLKTKGKIDHLFVTTGPTYRSMDGEYRSRMIPWHQFNRLFEKYSAEFEKIEGAILDKLSTGRLEFQTDFYYPANFSYNERNFEDSINTMRLPIKLYILCWAFDFYQIYMKTMENHANPAYQYILYQLVFCI